MIKECRVVLNNEACTVVLYNEIEVQLPPIKREADVIYVSFENGRYKVVDKDYKINKKTTIPVAKG